jgi:hypothetical protein
MEAARMWFHISAEISPNPAILCVVHRRFIDRSRTFPGTAAAGTPLQPSPNSSRHDWHHQLLGYSSETKVTNYKFLVRQEAGTTQGTDYGIA